MSRPDAHDAMIACMEAYWHRTGDAPLAAVEVSPDDYEAILPVLNLRKPLMDHGEPMREVEGVVLIVGSVQLRAVATVASGRPRAVPGIDLALDRRMPRRNPWISWYCRMGAALPRLVVT